MNGEHPSTERLQRGYDGELPSREAAEVSSHVASCAQCQGYVNQLGRLGQFVRIAAEDASASAAEPDFSRMFTQIEREIAKPARSLPGLPGLPALPALPGISSRAHSVSRWVSRGAPALGAVALAAAALLMVYRQDSLPSDVTDGSSFEAVVPAGHSEVVAVDFGSNAGQVFDIPLSDGSSIPVVWIDDDDEEEE